MASANGHDEVVKILLSVCLDNLNEQAKVILIIIIIIIIINIIICLFR